jgi:hypothetical protein
MKGRDFLEVSTSCIKCTYTTTYYVIMYRLESGILLCNDKFLCVDRIVLRACYLKVERFSLYAKDTTSPVLVPFIFV